MPGSDGGDAEGRGSPTRFGREEAGPRGVSANDQGLARHAAPVSEGLTVVDESPSLRPPVSLALSPCAANEATSELPLSARAEEPPAEARVFGDCVGSASRPAGACHELCSRGEPGGRNAREHSCGYCP